MRAITPGPSKGGAKDDEEEEEDVEDSAIFPPLTSETEAFVGTGPPTTSPSDNSGGSRVVFNGDVDGEDIAGVADTPYHVTN